MRYLPWLLVALLFSTNAFAKKDFCKGISCSNHGTCVVIKDRPGCACDGGYVPDATSGLNCLPMEMVIPQQKVKKKKTKHLIGRDLIISGSIFIGFGRLLNSIAGLPGQGYAYETKLGLYVPGTVLVVSGLGLVIPGFVYFAKWDRPMDTQPLAIKSMQKKAKLGSDLMYSGLAIAVAGFTLEIVSDRLENGYSTSLRVGLDVSGCILAIAGLEMLIAGIALFSRYKNSRHLSAGGKKVAVLPFISQLPQGGGVFGIIGLF